jgi:hypothetical protein
VRSIDAERPVSAQNFDPWKLFSVSEVAPVGGFAAQVIGEAADAEIRVVVGKEQRDLYAGIQFVGT